MEHGKLSGFLIELELFVVQHVSKLFKFCKKFDRLALMRSSSSKWIVSSKHRSFFLKSARMALKQWLDSSPDDKSPRGARM